MLDSVTMDLDVQTSRHGDAHVLTLQGEIDVYTAPRLRQSIADLVTAGARLVVVDMKDIDFLDSTGVGVLVQALRRLQARDGDLVIVVTQEKILKIFDITGLNRAFSIRSSLQEALPPSPAS